MNIRNVWFKLGATASIAFVLLAVGKATIDQMGELVHFNCKPDAAQVQCEFTQEPLIGTKETHYLKKSDLIKTDMQLSQELAAQWVDLSW